MTMYRVQDAAPIPFLIMAISNGTAAGLPIRTPAPDFSADRLLAADNPSGIGATVIPATTKRAADLHDLTLSTFLVDHPPGASTVLHRLQSSGYVLVYVLSSAIRASAWHTGVGTCRAGETRVEPAFAYRIASANANARESARALIILATGSQVAN
jgi:hypothetical protein